MNPANTAGGGVAGAAGGVISMCQAMPLIIGSVLAGLRDVKNSKQNGGTATRVPQPSLEIPASVDRVYGDYSRPGLRLVTCGGNWLGGGEGYSDNVIVFASLVKADDA